MSQQEDPPDGSVQDSLTRSSIQLVPDIHDEQILPPFQPFPARTPSAPSRRGDFAPSSGSRTAQWDLTSGMAHGSSHNHMQTAEDARIQASRQGVEGLESIQRRYTHTADLPEFTPFPAAASSSRYAPPLGSRAEPMRPVLPPIINPEASSGSRQSSAAGTEGSGSTLVTRHPM